MAVSMAWSSCMCVLPSQLDGHRQQNCTVGWWGSLVGVSVRYPFAYPPCMFDVFVA